MTESQLSDKNCWIKFKTSPPTPGLFVKDFTLSEAMGRLFEIEMNLISESDAIDHEGMLGKKAEIEMVLASQQYFLHGLIVGFGWQDAVNTSLGRIHFYRASVRPGLWMLTRTGNCRVFQEKAVPEIIEAVLGDHTVVDHRNNCKQSYAKLDYCVQYRESDFDFVSRLMEESGIYYRFDLEATKHTMVLSDSTSGYADSNPADFEFQVRDEHSAQRAHCIFSWSTRYVVQPAAYTLDDYNFETPSADLVSKEKTIIKNKFNRDFEVYDYPGGYGKLADGKPLVNARKEEWETGYQTASGTGDLPGLRCGQKFAIIGNSLLTDHQKSKWVVTKGKLSAVNEIYPFEDEKKGADFSFQAIPAKVNFRPRRTTQRPVIAGPQTAKVVGSKNSEIFTDKYGRVKVQFHWDREGKYDDKSSCWVRVAQTWTGKKWGTLHTPRVGQEVIVDFLEGDPDRPIVTGMVYNAEQMPPYALPDNGTQSGIKTQSSKQGNAKNFNELRFEDKKGKEHIYFHAERDFERVVENNDVLTVGFDAKDKGDQTVDIYNDQKITLEKGTRTTSIKVGDDLLTIDKGNRTSTIKQGDDTVDIKAGAHKTTASKSILFKVGGNSIKIDQQGVTIDATKITLKAKMKVVAQGPMVEAKADAMLTLKGGMTKIN